VCDGDAGVVVVRGEAGIGKSRLLDAVGSATADVDVVRLVGIESEMRLGFAALHQLLAPFLDYIDMLPPPQRRALCAAVLLWTRRRSSLWRFGVEVPGPVRSVRRNARRWCFVTLLRHGRSPNP
jgi:hypothetical protein